MLEAIKLDETRYTVSLSVCVFVFVFIDVCVCVCVCLYKSVRRVRLYRSVYLWFMFVFICLFVCVCLYQSVCLCLSLSLSVFELVFVFVFIELCVCFSVCLYKSVCLVLSLSVCLSVFILILSVCVSVFVFINLFDCVFLYLSVCQSLSSTHSSVEMQYSETLLRTNFDDDIMNRFFVWTTVSQVWTFLAAAYIVIVPLFEEVTQPTLDLIF